LDLLRSHKDDLKEFLNVSQVTVLHNPELDNPDVDTSFSISIRVSPATGSKCARCWNFMPDTADYGIWQNVCGRCRSALHEMGIAPPTPEAAQ